MQNTVLTPKWLLITNCHVPYTRLGFLGLEGWLLPLAWEFTNGVTCPVSGPSASKALGTSFQLCQMLDSILYTELCSENVLSFAFAFILAFETLVFPLWVPVAM